MRKYLITSVAAVVILATGCAEMSDTQRRTATKVRPTARPEPLRAEGDGYPDG